METGSGKKNQVVRCRKSVPLSRGGHAPSPDVELPVTVEQFSELTGMYYQGPLEAVPWSSALGLLRKHLKANWTVLILRPASKNWPAIMIRAGVQGAELYNAEYIQYQSFSLDPFVGLPPGRVVTLDEMIDVPKWTKGEFFKQFVEPFDIRYVMGSDILAEGGGECRLRCTRPPGGKDFSAGDKALFQMLLPHFKRAVDLHFRIEAGETERLLYANTMDRMLVGTVILDQTGEIMRCSGVAEEMLAEKDGVIKGKGVLRAAYPQEDRQLQQLIAQALAIPAGVAAVPEAISLGRPSGRQSLGILIRHIPMVEWSEGRRRPAVAVFIRDPERSQQPAHGMVMQLFGLTSTEATLSMLLANGLTLDEAAKNLNIRKNTVRAHLRAIFSKTGVTRQTALVRLLLSSVASIA